MALVSLPSSPQTLTLVEKQVRVSAAIKQRTAQAFQMLHGTAAQLKALVWANPDGLTPQEVLDAVGHDAVALFQVSSLVTQILAIATGSAPAAVMPEGWDFTANEDGTVTLVPPQA